MIRALPGWLLVQPLGTPRERLCVGRVHSLGALSDEQAKHVPFGSDDRVAWPVDAPCYPISDHLALVPLQALIAYELTADLVESNGDERERQAVSE
jgi:hypothetical protein